MNFTDAVKACFNKYATFSGRATRPEFWWFVLFQMIVLVVAGMLGKFAYCLAVAALFVPAIAVGTRRLHDIGKSGWFQLLYLIPVIGFFVLLYWFLQASGGPNDYGNPEVTPYSPTVMPGPGPGPR
ncbi:DUF805 domain-containing protein [Ramlibacter sp. G-1-2-2]|uniref:DUF805 domain-containing protein n=1 Tax=Ramlibacter agri TaxID=2728837 RepID=A0A848HE04_9BURK|nr:DUF805 domain-containing protein [Ramlibacter agri]NML48402.1 DUF805 domain-containing protein [Ramlibacter agri]